MTFKGKINKEERNLIQAAAFKGKYAKAEGNEQG
jgi:hypothetical protein